MPFTREDVLATARRSLAAAGDHDRDAWVGLFAADAVVEDPVGSVPHRGRSAIARFYDTFVGPRALRHDSSGDFTAGTSVVRDVELHIGMTPAVVLDVPAYVRYEVGREGTRAVVTALAAYWELPAMLRQFLRAGPGAVPAGAALSRTMAANQGAAGVLGFAAGLRGTGSGARALVTRFLDSACRGDELGGRRLLGAAPVTVGDSGALTASELIRELSGGRVDKVVRSGRAVVARVDHDDSHRVVLCDTVAGAGRERARLGRVRIYRAAEGNSAALSPRNL
jgi:hypothetical protein